MGSNTYKFLVEVPAHEALNQAIVGRGLEGVLRHHTALDISVTPLSQSDAVLASSERRDVAEFHAKFGVQHAPEPALLAGELRWFRLRALREEVDEFETALMVGDLADAGDALVDLAYFLHGTALIMHLPWAEMWAEVHAANMAKERAATPAQSKRGTALDVVKPAGWCAPDHRQFLGGPPWPTFHADGSLSAPQSELFKEEL